MFQFPHLPPPPLCVQGGVTRVLLAGLPHSGIAGALPACGPPALFAACHALHRPLSPRHPPHTVCIVSEIASRPRPGPAAANASLDAPLPRATRDPSISWYSTMRDLAPRTNQRQHHAFLLSPGSNPTGASHILSSPVHELYRRRAVVGRGSSWTRTRDLCLIRAAL